MGMYTRFWGTIKVKPEYIIMIERLCDWETTPRCWRDLVSDYPEVAEYSKVDRSSFIPRGCYADHDVKYQIVDDIFTFDCMLKNYVKTIEAFMEMIVPVIAVEAELYRQYEECISPDVFVFKDGIMTETQEEKFEEY